MPGPNRALPIVACLATWSRMTADYESKGQMALRPTMQQELVFSSSSLPATMDLAAAFRPLIKVRLGNISARWPFEDRVLVWLIPGLRKDVELFHGADGPAMDQVFGQEQLANLDGHFFRILASRLDEICPGTIKNLIEIGSSEAEKAPTLDSRDAAKTGGEPDN